jgi:CPA1 family monovalent cation:H+ antiporter
MGYTASLFSKRPTEPRNLMVVSWTGMRGVVSLATALALPVEIGAGRDFPHRNLIIFVAFTVILATLVIQGLTLGPLIRLLGLHADSSGAREEAIARMEAAKAALAALSKLENDTTLDRQSLHRLRSDYEHRIADLHSTSGTTPVIQVVQANAQMRHLRVVALSAERNQIVAMRNGSIIGDEILHRIEREIDLEELGLS